ncbi:hypothetical protein M2T28_14395 [Elizabethkingia miricola]|uniref:hypothetical protein n=1 Tax=Elizabethkingia miricola TaxID=172045 RepID=UPI002018DD69|nr:hypothetical protein [Elizabethkingia miricola]MCL1653809.1 hypothetical protein [Elizabethkingia miricola]
MFDKSSHFYTNIYQLNGDVNVKEYKAPTDESIRILNEFEKKSEENIVNKINVKISTIDTVHIGFSHDPCLYGINHFVKFNLNGEEHKLKYNVEYEEYDNNKCFGIPFNIAEHLIEYMSRAIAKEVLLKGYPNEVIKSYEKHLNRQGNY